MIYVGIDDTDTLETRGTNQLAKALVRRVRQWFRPVSIVRHQLLFDPRVPYTSKNGSASIRLEPVAGGSLDQLVDLLTEGMLDDFVPGSDPGLCVTDLVNDAVIEFGRRCQKELVTQADAQAVASASGLYLKGLGGTRQGIIGAVAAVGLIHTGQDGRVVQMGEWPDDLTGPTPVSAVRARGVRLRDEATGRDVGADTDRVDVGKHLRPNVRDHGYAVFVRPVEGEEMFEWSAQKLV